MQILTAGSMTLILFGCGLVMLFVPLRFILQGIDLSQNGSKKVTISIQKLASSLNHYATRLVDVLIIALVIAIILHPGFENLRKVQQPWPISWLTVWSGGWVILLVSWIAGLYNQYVHKKEYSQNLSEFFVCIILIVLASTFVGYVSMSINPLKGMNHRHILPIVHILTVIRAIDLFSPFRGGSFSWIMVSIVEYSMALIGLVLLVALLVQ